MFILESLITVSGLYLLMIIAHNSMLVSAFKNLSNTSELQDEEA